MGRSSRSSKLRANREQKRNDLYGPKNDEALARLNAKLNDIRAKSPPPPPVNKSVEVEQPDAGNDADVMATDDSGNLLSMDLMTVANLTQVPVAFDAMDVDSLKKKTSKKLKYSTQKQKRVEKKLKHRKVKSMIAFPVKLRSKRRQPRI